MREQGLAPDQAQHFAWKASRCKTRWDHSNHSHDADQCLGSWRHLQDTRKNVIVSRDISVNESGAARVSSREYRSPGEQVPCTELCV
jgi:hypothetical protein